MARPRKPIDGGEVERLASIFCTENEIALVVGCSVDTLHRRFAECIEKGWATAKSSLRRRQWEQAEKGNATMLIWLGKQMLAQSDRQEVTHVTLETIEAELARIEREREHAKRS